MSISYFAPAGSFNAGDPGNAMCQQSRSDCNDVFPGFNSLSVLRVALDGSQAPWGGYHLAENCGAGNYVCEDQYSPICYTTDGRRMRRYANAVFTMPTREQDSGLDYLIFQWIWNDQLVTQNVYRTKGEPR